MSKMKLLCAIGSAALLLSSCQKEADFDQGGSNGGPGGGSAGLVGNYRFVGVEGNTKSTVTIGTGIDQEKSITTFAFISKNNSGTSVFTSNQFNSVNWTYTVDSIAHADFYLGGILFGSVDQPFSYTIPPSNGSSSYRTIGTDSMYFDNGVTSTPTGGGAPTPAVPSGARYSWSGDTLKIRVILDTSFAQDIGGGDIAQIRNQATQIVKLKKN